MRTEVTWNIEPPAADALAEAEPAPPAVVLPPVLPAPVELLPPVELFPPVVLPGVRPEADVLPVELLPVDALPVDEPMPLFDAIVPVTSTCCPTCLCSSDSCPSRT